MLHVATQSIPYDVAVNDNNKLLVIGYHYHYICDWIYNLNCTFGNSKITNFKH